MFDCVPSLPVKIRILADAQGLPADCCERQAADALETALIGGVPSEIASARARAESVCSQLQVSG